MLQIIQHTTDILNSLIPEQQPCALIDFPDHANVGDSAIWWGERVYQRQRRIDVRYVCSVDTFSEKMLRWLMPEGVILIHGGGNFGTLWPRHQALREKILTNLKDYKVIQLPQSLYFEDKQSLKLVSEIVKTHPDFTLLVRDAVSQAIARNGLGIDALLCPDSAMFLAGRLHRPEPVFDCVGLCRIDKERQFAALPKVLRSLTGVAHIGDWLDEPFNVPSFCARNVGRLSRYASKLPASLCQYMLAKWDCAAQQRVERGCRLLGQGRVVVTDRLHAQILALLMGIPSVSLDNNYRKIGNYLETWLSQTSGCQRIESLEMLPAALAEYLT